MKVPFILSNLFFDNVFFSIKQQTETEYIKFLPVLCVKVDEVLSISRFIETHTYVKYLSKRKLLTSHYKFCVSKTVESKILV